MLDLLGLAFALAIIAATAIGAIFVASWAYPDRSLRFGSYSDHLVTIRGTATRSFIYILAALPLFLAVALLGIVPSIILVLYVILCAGAGVFALLVFFVTRERLKEAKHRK